ncbi:Delta 9 fatty acid desaturase [Phaffia rhodozyma]|uniref:stearoyl-CoA 9-desaturase n=1 Tax=Phaffia rhodozyma TaxID=264483 RepID=A0A0F7SQH3_PHARH|nr:Delta 9 fatty acid desaturase [Phaffia rhodozyma]
MSNVSSEMKQRPRSMSPPLSPPLSPQSKASNLLGDIKLPTLAEPKTPSEPTDLYIQDNYVQAMLDKQKTLSPITWRNLIHNIQWISFLAITVTPSIAIFGFFTTAWNTKTAIWSVIYYFMTGMSITAGYHRLYAHRSYNAARPLEYAFAVFGAGAVEGSIKWWSRGHRAHHRYTDTDLDPYNAHKGFFYSHIGWMLIKPRGQIGTADISDLSRNPVVKFQQKWYVYLIIGMGFLFPTAVAGLLWGDWAGGFYFAGAARLCFVHHSTFCVNSLAHWLGDSPFDDKHTPKDHFITALVTNGEGYHNFHHQFPMDYRNAIKWFQYDPTKWFIYGMSLIGQASHLKTFPANEISKGQYTMKLKKLEEETQNLKWPVETKKLPVVSWEDFTEESKHRPLMAIHGYIHDCSAFADEHPGGAHLIKRAIGTDATAAFFGGVYDHSNAAHNLLAMMRVGILEAGMEVEHLKKDFANSEINPDRHLYTTDGQQLPNAEERLQQTQLNSQGPRPKAPMGQPQATMADRFTLNVPPSERLRIIHTVPSLRPGRESRAGQLQGSMKAEMNGEIDPLIGKN